MRDVQAGDGEDRPHDIVVLEAQLHHVHSVVLPHGQALGKCCICGRREVVKKFQINHVQAVGLRWARAWAGHARRREELARGIVFEAVSTCWLFLVTLKSVSLPLVRVVSCLVVYQREQEDQLGQQVASPIKYSI